MKEVVFPGVATLQSGDLKTGVDALQNGELKDADRADRQAAGKLNADQEIGGPRWHSRGYLPHFECNEVIQHVTFHLADSLPKDVVERMDEELRSLPTEEQDTERRRRVDAWIDAGHGLCVLREPAIAEMVQDSFFFFDDQHYRLLAWVIMPNHVHVLFQPINNWTVSKIVASWKKFTARRVSDFLRANPDADLEIGGHRGKRIWHREYWDRYIRDETHFCRTIEYIHQNPVKAGLVEKPEEWRWSSAPILYENADREIGDPRGKQEIGGPRKSK